MAESDQVVVFDLFQKGKQAFIQGFQGGWAGDMRVGGAKAIGDDSGKVLNCGPVGSGHKVI